jgi:hypothetical protein
LPGVDAAQHRGDGAHDQGQRDHCLGDRDEDRRRAQVQRRPVEGDEEAEADVTAEMPSGSMKAASSTRNEPGPGGGGGG